MKKCNVCNKEYDDNLNFCPVCGSKLEEILPQPVAEKENPDSENTVMPEESNAEETEEKLNEASAAVAETEVNGNDESPEANENEEVRQERFCPACGQKINDPNSKFCLMCGAELNANYSQAKCPKCDEPISDPNAKFCEFCGADLSAPKQSNAPISDFVKKVGENDFVKSVKNDFKNSESLNLLKDKVNSAAGGVKVMSYDQKRKIGIIAAVIGLILIALVVAANFHVCEECDEVYFGKKYTINFLGESEEVCKDCYDDFYSGWGF